MTKPHHVVVIGGGFGGLNAANRLGGGPVCVTLLDRRNFHLFQPLLYQVATGGLSPANIASPLRRALRGKRNVQVLLGEVTDFDVENRRVILADGMAMAYDSLIVAAGSTNSYFGKTEWELLAPGLKTVEDATEVRRKVLLAFEMAERETNKEKLATWLTFIVVGGGPTGVELAGALAEISRDTLKHDFRTINPADAKIILVQSGDRILEAYDPWSSEQAVGELASLGVTVRTGQMVQEIGEDYVILKKTGSNPPELERIATRTVLWGAGVAASPLGKKLADRSGATTDRGGRIVVQPDCSLPGHPEVFVIGDMAHFPLPDNKTLPGVAQVALQQGAFVAKIIRDRQNGNPPDDKFVYKDLGSMATIGRAKAIAEVNGWKFHGYIAWLMWLFIHVMYLIEFQNRVLVMMQWAFNYITFNRSARLITQDQSGPMPWPTKDNPHVRDAGLAPSAPVAPVTAAANAVKHG
ncbi:MAG TPA: NAD(P)/FAD-dependent oxidoreductase [Pirellulales bacterium]